MIDKLFDTVFANNKSLPLKCRNKTENGKIYVVRFYDLYFVCKASAKEKIIGEIPLVETSAVSSDGDICNFNFYYTDCESRLATKEEERLFIRIMSHDRNKEKGNEVH